MGSSQESNHLVKSHTADRGRKPNVVVGMDMFDVPNDIEHRFRSSVQNEIVQSLSYPEMDYRYEDVVEAHPETYQWVFHEEREYHQLGSNLSGWLKEVDGVYWVNGKAGSKSTFMKYLPDTNQLRDYLGLWAGDVLLCVVSFFFWNSGTKLQKSQVGFLRALLFQVLSLHPDLVPVILPGVWALAYSNATRLEPLSLIFRWLLSQLMDAFRALGKQTSIPINICILIDGLDEFDGNHDDMGELFKELTISTHVKASLSSRPWIVFEDLFASCPKMYLQDVTYRDIEKYIGDRLNRSEQYRRLTDKHPEESLALGKEILEKADGVYLWVKLVVDSLLNGVRNRDEFADLWERLRLLPKDLEPLYCRFLGLVQSIYMPWFSQVFQILRANRDPSSASSVTRAPQPGIKPLSLSALFFAICKDVNSSSINSSTKRQHKARCDDTKVQLAAQCAGFLEVLILSGESFTGPESRIQCFHRTARDIIESELQWPQLLLETDNTHLDAYISMTKSCLLCIEFRIARKFLDDEMAITEVADEIKIYAASAA